VEKYTLKLDILLLFSRFLLKHLTVRLLPARVRFRFRINKAILEKEFQFQGFISRMENDQLIQCKLVYKLLVRMSKCIQGFIA